MAAEVALVTGGARRIGRAIVERLAESGYAVVIHCNQSRSEAEELAAQIRAKGGQAAVVTADLVDAAAVDGVLPAAEAAFGPVTLLVNNAGVGTHTPLLDSDVDAMNRMIDLNVNALTRLTYAAVPGFVARGRGAIINISSIVGIAPHNH